MMADQVSIFADERDPLPTVEPESADRDYDGWLATQQALEAADYIGNLRNEASGPDTTKAREARAVLREWARQYLPDPDEWEHPSERWPGEL